MAEIVTVFGATGLQGGSVIRAIQKDPTLSSKFSIRAVTRDATSPAALALAENDIEVVTATQDSPSSVAAAVSNAHTVFLVTSFEASFSAAIEEQQGRTVADACAAAGTQHLIFSSLPSFHEASHGRWTRVDHFESKARVEKYIRSLNVPATFVQAGSYMQNLFTLMHKAPDGTYQMTLPVGDAARFPLLDVAADYGKYVAAVLRDRKAFLGRTVRAAQRYYAPSEIVAEFERSLQKQARFVTVSPAEFVKMAPPQMAEDLAEMAQAYADPGYFGGADLSEDHALIDGGVEALVNLQSFLTVNKDRF